MITMLTSISHMDIGENNSHLNTLKTPPATLFFSLFFLYPQKVAKQSLRRCLTIPKKVPDNPKKDAYAILAEISCGALVTLHSRLVYWATRSIHLCVCTLMYAPLHHHATPDNITEGTLPALGCDTVSLRRLFLIKKKVWWFGMLKPSQSFFTRHIFAAHLFLSVYTMTRWNALLYPQQGVSSVYTAPSPALPLCAVGR